MGDDASQEVEGETPKERVNRELIELLNEVRVALPGVQVLFAFLLTVPFAAGWKDTTNLQKDVYVCAVVTAAIAAIFMIAPSSYHRLLFRQPHKEHMLMTSNKLLIIGMVFLALSICMCVFLVVDFVISIPWALTLTGLVGLLMIVLWYLMPLNRRHEVWPPRD
ncbi:MAG: DUF6328 family protein [Gaiellales bacterium]